MRFGPRHPILVLPPTSLKYILCLLLAVWIQLAVASPLSAQNGLTKRVLVLHSYYRGFSWTDEIDGGIQSIFKQSALKVAIQIEYLDIGRISDPTYLWRIPEIYSYKYGEQQPDVIISVDNDALEFLFTYRDLLFPDTPVVFCAVKSFDDKMLEGHPFYTGIVEEIDARETIDLALKLHPDTKRIVIYGDELSKIYGYNRNILKKIIPDYTQTVDVTLKENLDIVEIQEEVLEFPPNTLIFLASEIRDSFNELMPFDQSGEKVAVVSHVPIYSFWDMYLGHGIVGGKLVNGFAQGEAAAQMALKILEGKNFEEIPVLKGSPNRYMFDYKLIKQFNLHLYQLPENSIIINKPQSIFSETEFTFPIIVALIIVFILVLLIFIINSSSRKKTIGELHLQKAYFQQLFENSPQGIVILDDAYHVVAANEAFQKIFQYDIEEIRGNYLNNFIVPGELLESPLTLFRVTLGKKISQKEALRKRKDGSYIYVSILSYPIEFNNEQIGAYEIYNDITERMNAEQALKKSHDRFVAVMDSLDAAVYVADMETYEILFANKYVRNIVGDDLVGKTCWKVLHEGQSAPCAFCTNKKLIDADGNPSLTYAWESKKTLTGTWCAIRDRAIQWVDGRIVRLQIATDITDIKRGEKKLKLALEALRKGEERLRRMIQNMPVMMNAFDTEGNIVAWNRESERVTGYSEVEIAGNPDALKLLYPDADYRRQMLEMGKEDSRVFRDLELKTRCKDGTIKVISWSNISSHFPISGWASWAIGVDITDRKQLEEERLNTSKLASINVLAGGIAHDFNNLLTGILGNIQLAKMYLPDDKKSTKKLEESEKISLRAKNLVSRLLTLYRGEDPVKKKISLAELAKNRAEIALSGSNVKCEYHFPEDLWLVECDPGQIGQVIGNLTINAKESMQEGGTLKISAKNLSITSEHPLSPKPGDYVRISFIDHGVGIPEEHLSKIFDPYFSTKPKTTEKGTGLGLSNVHLIIKNHQGYIDVKSKVGEGTIFYVYLPAIRKEIPLQVQMVEKPSKGIGRVLLMDDEEVVRDVCAEMLRHLGYEVAFARDGAEAIEKYEDSIRDAQPFDAVILDLTIPGGMGAIDTISKLIDIDPRVKCIVSSGYTNDAAMSDFQEYGFKRAVTKPYQIVELSRTLQEVIEEKDQ